MDLVQDLRERPIRRPRASRERLHALGAWYEVERDRLVRFAFLLSGDLLSAEDLVHEAMVKMHRAGADPADPGIGSYARAAIVSVSRSLHRKRTRERAAVDRLHPRASHEVAEREMGAPAEMWAAILGLSRMQRAVIVLRFYEGMTEPEVAAVLGASIGSVKKHSGRALTKLREQFGRNA